VHEQVAAYLDRAPEEQRPVLLELRSMIAAALPGAEEAVESGFPVYKLHGGWVAGFASRKQGPMLYIMRSAVLDAHAEKLGDLRTGKSCLIYRPTAELSAVALKRLAKQMLREASQS